MIRANLSEIDKGDDVLVVGGTNDICDLNRLHGRGRTAHLDKLEFELGSAIRSLREKGANVLLLVTPPRKYVHINDCSAIQDVITEVSKNLNVSHMTVFQHGETWEQFIESGLWEDGVHFEEDRLRYVISKAVERLNRKERLRDKFTKIDRRSVWPNDCWVCGRKGQGTSC